MKKYAISLQQSIALVVFIAALPGFLVAAVGFQQYQERKLTEGAVRLRELGNSVAISQMRVAENVGQLLNLMRSGPAVQRTNLQELCQEYLSNVFKATSSIAYVGVAETSGELPCSVAAPNFAPLRSIRHLRSYSLASRSGVLDAVHGELGLMASEPVLYFLSPMPGRALPGHRDMAIVALRLSAFSEALAALKLDPGVRVEVIDSSGRALAALAGSVVPGTADPGAYREYTPLRGEPDIYQWKDSLGADWLQVVRPVQLTGLPDTVLRVSLRESELVSKGRQQLLTQVIALVLLSLLSMTFALFLARRYLSNPSLSLLQRMGNLESLDAAPVASGVAPREVLDLGDGLEALRLRLQEGRAHINKLLQEQLEIRSRLLRAQELTQVGTFEVVLPGRQFTATSACFSILGATQPANSTVSRAQVVRQIHPEDRKRVIQWRKKLGRGGAPSTIELRVLRMDGTVRWVAVVAQLVCAPDGHAWFYSGAMQDVTDKKIAQFDVLRKEEDLQMAGRLAQLYRWAYNVKTGALEWSNEVDELMGYPPGAAPRNFETLLQVVHPQDREALLAQVEIDSEAAQPLDKEIRICRADDSVRYVHLRIEMVRDEYRQESYFNGVVQDVTARVLAEQRLRTQVSRLQLLRDIAKAMSERLGANGVVSVVCESVHQRLPASWCAFALHDVESREITIQLSAGQRVLPGLGPGTRVSTEGNGLSRCVRGGLVHERDVGSVPFVFPQQLARAGLKSVVLVPVLEEGGKVSAVLIVADDQRSYFESADCEFLSQLGEQLGLALHQVELYASLQKAYTELQSTQGFLLQQERMSALGQMASGIAHDVNNALSPATIYLEDVLESEPDLSARAKRQLGIVQQSLEDVSSTIARMRSFYGKEDPNAARETTEDINLVFDDVLVRTESRWKYLPMADGAQLEIIRDFSEERLSCSVSPSELRDALTNLVLNSVDALPQGGTLTVGTQRSLKPGFVELFVSDTGVGMDEETRKRCLEPFYSTKGQRGTGLGLPMVAAMASRGGGEMLIESELGRGTEIRLRLPMELRSGAEAPESEPSLAFEEPAPLTLLLVDDDPSVLDSLGSVLRRKGHTVITALGGPEGLALLETSGFVASLDAVVTDLGMPGIDGHAIARRAKELAQSLPVVVLTGWGSRMLEETGDNIPNVDRIMSKPPSANALLAVLAELLVKRVD